MKQFLSRVVFNMISASPVSAPSALESRVVIRETRRTSAIGKVIVGLIGLVVTAGFTFYQSKLKIDPETALMLAILLALAVLSLGVGTLLAWRKSGDFEAVEVKNHRVRLVIAPFKNPFFDAPVSETRIQRFVLPKGSWKLFLRDGSRAVELGADLPEKERADLADRLDRLINSFQSPG